MPRPKKVKRYKKIYRSSGFTRRITPLRVAATIVVVLGLFALGWGLYTPVYNFIMGNISLEPRTEDPSGSSSQVLDLDEPGGGDIVPDDDVSVLPPITQTKEIRGVYMPEATLYNATQRQAFLSNLDGTDINAVMFDLKNTSGVVTYRSGLDSVAQVEAVAASAVELSTFLSELRARGLTPIGRIHAFRDPLAASGLSDAMVKYNNTDWTWLDNSAELGGKPWLNPFSETARQYIIDIAVEASGLGVGEIVLDSVHFPVGFSLELATYGRVVNNQDKQTVLSSFAQSVAESVGSSAHVSVYLPVTSVLGTDQERYAGSPVGIVGDSVYLGVMPSLFGNAYQTEEILLESPVTTPYNTVLRSLRVALPKLPGRATTVALVQSYTATNVEPLYNTTYTATHVNEQIQALGENGVENYILYSPDGTYYLT